MGKVWKKTGNPMGRPKVEIPIDILNTACQFDANMNQVLELLDRKGIKTTDATVNNFCKRMFGMTFLEYKDKRFDYTRLMLKQKAMNMANNGNVTMLIFCLKNLCKWTDRVESNVTATVEMVPKVVFSIDDDETN